MNAERLIHLIEQGRAEPFHEEHMQAWADGWNASIDNVIRLIRLQDALDAGMERAAKVADYADWTTAELSFERG